MEVYFLTAGKFSGVFASEDLAQKAAKKIAIEHKVRLKARVECYPLNETDHDTRYHERMSPRKIK